MSMFFVSSQGVGDAQIMQTGSYSYNELTRLLQINDEPAEVCRDCRRKWKQMVAPLMPLFLESRPFRYLVYSAYPVGHLSEVIIVREEDVSIDSFKSST